jgi:hypothetical protein
MKFQGRGMAADIDRAGVAKAYERWAPSTIWYSARFSSGRQSTIAEADRIAAGPRCRRRHRIVAVGFADDEIVRRRYLEPMLPRRRAASVRWALKMSRRSR